jgi:aspartate--ammonia ligase
MESILPEQYQPLLNLYDTQLAIGALKSVFEAFMIQRLKVHRASAPLLVDANSNVNDSKVGGGDQPVVFQVPAISATVEVVQSLDKWKRSALHRYGFPLGEGLYMDMNAIRWNEKPDYIHSIYVDHWDWARRISESERTLDTLYQAVFAVVNAICDTEITIRNTYPQLLANPELSRQVKFITAQELEELYPDQTPKERETTIAREYQTVFILGVGHKRKNGEPHRRRAADCEDWDLSGELLFWDSVLQIGLPVASMGIQVDGTALERQLREAGCAQLLETPYHQAVLAGELPQVIGGGIGQSRLAMLILGKAHIGEVHPGIWDQETQSVCQERKVPLL